MDNFEPQDSGTKSPEQDTQDSPEQTARKRTNKIVGLTMMVYWIPVIALVSYLHIPINEQAIIGLIVNIVLGFVVFREETSQKLVLWVTIRVVWGIASGIIDMVNLSDLSWLGLYEILIWAYIGVRYRQPFGQHSLRIASWLLLPLSLGALVNIFIEFSQHNVFHKVAVFNKRDKSFAIVLLTNMEKSIHRYMLRVRITDDSIAKLTSRFCSLDDPNEGLPILDSLVPLDSDRQVNVSACLPVFTETMTKVKENPDTDSLLQRAGIDLLQGYKELYETFRENGTLLDSLRKYTLAIRHSTKSRQEALRDTREEYIEKVKKNNDHIYFTIHDMAGPVHILGFDE